MLITRDSDVISDVTYPNKKRLKHQKYSINCMLSFMILSQRGYDQIEGRAIFQILESCQLNAFKQGCEEKK